MWSVSAVADPRDAIPATASPFKFDFVAFLKRRYGLKNWKIRGKNKLDPSKKLQKQQSSRNRVVNLEAHLWYSNGTCGKSLTCDLYAFKISEIFGKNYKWRMQCISDADGATRLKR